MYIFKKGSDFVQIEEGNKIQLHLLVLIAEVDTTFLIEIPSLDIHAYSSKKENIDKRIDESFNSFFKYWLKMEGKERLISHMLALGFKISLSTGSTANKSSDFKKITSKGTKSRFIFNEELLIA